MPRPSPQTERLVEVLEFLAADTSRQRSLSDIARMLHVDKATCLPMVTELTRVGWLVRHPQRRTYQLGPRLVSIGEAARGATNVVDMARPAIAALADELNVVCAAIINSGDELVVADLVQPRGRRRPAMGQQIGDHVAIRPPLAGIFVAWEDESVVAEWLARDPMTASDPKIAAHYRDVLKAVRARGFGVEHRPIDSPPIGTAIEEVLQSARGTARAKILATQHERLMHADMVAAELDPDRTYVPFSINAAAFDDSARPVLAICGYDFDEQLSASEVFAIGLTIRAAAREVTAVLHGVEPVVELEA